MIAIFMFSSQNGTESSELSDKVSIKLLEIIFCENVTYVVRKSAHFIIYATLGFFMALHMNFYKISLKVKYAVSLVICFIYASTDEFHQLFVDERSGQFSDVMLDTCGSLAGIALFSIIFFIIRKVKNLTADSL
jgi:VanZ family protein